jgi:DNA-binding MarR family transcriptional regulator/GNAT superfamily N-acetyltransferase
MGDASIEQVRRFNRVVTQRIGALNDQYLGRGRPLGASRLLWEIGDDGSDIRMLRSRLDLDSGYLSRLLRSLEHEGLIAVEPDATDKRVRNVRLTKTGRDERRLLDERSDELAQSLLAPLDETRRAQLVASMETVARLLTAGLVAIGIEDPNSDVAAFCLSSYFAELDARLDTGFDPAQSRPTSAPELTEPAGLFLVARLHDEAIGCGGLKLHGDWAEIKRMWVAPSARGLGVGRRILHELEQCAAQRAVSVLRLDTNRALAEAKSLYCSAGFVEVEPFNDEPYAHHWFEKRLES